MIILPIVLPILAGTVLLLLPDRLFNNRNRLIVVVGILIALVIVLAIKLKKNKDYNEAKLV